METITAGDAKVTIDAYPTRCPLCNHAIHPAFLHGIMNYKFSHDSFAVELLFQCPVHTCRRGFIGRYFGSKRISPGTGMTAKLRSVTPFEPPTPSQPAIVTELSPQFADIYSQAAKAEAYGLHQVAGCGYRKALEFLIKDYCASREPEAAETIRKKPLANVIADHVKDEHIRECALRATWLGNDETHYVRVWETKDIADLKVLIELTVSGINSDLLKRRYLDDMKRPVARK